MKIAVSGEIKPGFERVWEEFDRLWQDIEVGASFCAYHQGEKVVDIWGGYTDQNLTQRWQEDTLVNIFSTTKGFAALAVAILFDQQKIDYQEKVASYWPEFGCHGKESITLAQLLSHQAGLCGVQSTLTIDDLYHWDKMVQLLAAQPPLWQPGTAAGYHALTWGYLVGELVRRISGKTLVQYVAEKISQPLGADVFIGLPRSEFNRCATLIGPNHARKKKQTNHDSHVPEVSTLNYIAMQNPVISPYNHACSEPWRLAEISASNGHANARGIATVYGALAMGGTLGTTTIASKAAIDAATRIEVDDKIDLVLARKVRRGRGFILNTNNDYGPNLDAFGHNGAGGSTGFADPITGIGIGYAMNQMKSEYPAKPRSRKLIDAVYACI